MGIAVVEGLLDESKNSYHQFLDNHQDIANKYGYQYNTGWRNLRANVLKCIKRINWYRHNGKHDDKGKRKFELLPDASYFCLCYLTFLFL